MNPINERINRNVDRLLREYRLTEKTRTTSGAVTDYLTVNECAAEFIVTPEWEDISVLHPQGGWMMSAGFTKQEIWDL